MRRIAALLLVLAVPCASSLAAETLVANVAEFDAAVKAAKPGDSIVLRNGEWRDAELVFHGTGRAPTEDVTPVGDAHFIKLRAETPGKVILTGTSRLRIGGKWLLVEGLHWQNTAARGHVVAFRIDSKTLADHCEMRDCAIVDDNADGSASGDGSEKNADRKWVSIYGVANRVERCRFEGKRSVGSLMVVWVPDDAPPWRDDPSENWQDANRTHHIEHNYFGPRDKLGKNGGETIRVGDSKTSRRVGRTHVCRNYFYRCNGEAEIISNKSCGNWYYGNMFVGCSGALTLRHGHSCAVFDCVFDGDDRKGTGGVRVVGRHHSVGHCLFRNLTGDEVRSALCIMNGIPDSPADGYAPVYKLRVDANTFVGCKQNILLGFADKDRKNQTVAPDEVVFERNVVVGDSPVFAINSLPTSLRSDKNLYSGKLGLADEFAEGWTKAAPAQIDTQPKIPPGNFLSKPLERVGPTWFRPTAEVLPRDKTK